MYVNTTLFIIICALAVPGVLLVLSIIVIKIWPRSDDIKFLKKENKNKIDNLDKIYHS